MQALLIFLGSGIGGLFRYFVSNLTYRLLGRGFPYGTLLVNITGSLLMGLLFVLIMDRYEHPNLLRSLLLIGFLGGYTTFSSFSIETINLLETGNYLTATFNVLLSVMLCLLGVWIGAILGKQI